MFRSFSSHHAHFGHNGIPRVFSFSVVGIGLRPLRGLTDKHMIAGRAYYHGGFSPAPGGFHWDCALARRYFCLAPCDSNRARALLRSTAGVGLIGGGFYSAAGSGQRQEDYSMSRGGGHSRAGQPSVGAETAEVLRAPLQSLLDALHADAFGYFFLAARPRL